MEKGKFDNIWSTIWVKDTSWEDNEDVKEIVNTYWLTNEWAKEMKDKWIGLDFVIEFIADFKGLDNDIATELIDEYWPMTWKVAWNLKSFKNLSIETKKKLEDKWRWGKVSENLEVFEDYNLWNTENEWSWSQAIKDQLKIFTATSKINAEALKLTLEEKEILDENKLKELAYRKIQEAVWLLTNVISLKRLKTMNQEYFDARYNWLTDGGWYLYDNKWNPTSDLPCQIDTSRTDTWLHDERKANAEIINYLQI